MPTTSLTLGTIAASTGTGTYAWTNTSNALSSSDAGASATASNATWTVGGTSQKLRITGFDFSAIPDTATIDGVYAVVRIKSANTPAEDFAFRINYARLVISGTATGNTKTASAHTQAFTDVTFGGVADKWGLTPTGAEIKAATSGIEIGVINNDGKVEWTSATVSIDYIQLRVTYTEAAATTTTTTTAATTTTTVATTTTTAATTTTTAATTTTTAQGSSGPRTSFGSRSFGGNRFGFGG